MEKNSRVYIVTKYKKYIAVVSLKRINENNKIEQYEKTIGYFNSKREANKALDIYYNSENYKKDNTITISQIYEKILLNDNSILLTKEDKYSYRKISNIHNFDFNSIDKNFLSQYVNQFKTVALKKKIKTLFSKLFKASINIGLCDENITSCIKFKKEYDSLRYQNYFKDKEIIEIQNLDRSIGRDLILFSIFSGLQINKILSLKNSRIDLENMIVITNKGTSKIIKKYKMDKICSEIICRNYDKNNEFLFLGENKKNISYDYFYKSIWKKIMKKVTMKHYPQDGYATFLRINKGGKL